MKGLGTMIVIISSIAATMACSGCAGLPDQQSAEPAAAPSHGMMLATPDAYGLGSTAPQALAATDIRTPGYAPLATSALSGGRVSLSQGPVADETATVTADAVAILPETLNAKFWDASPALTEITAERTLAGLLEPQDTEQSIGAELALAASSERTGLAFDVGVAPRLSIARDGDLKTRRFGGELRIGQNFDKRGEKLGAKGWYIFAGADGEAVIWEPGDRANGEGLSLNDMALHDYVTIGDMQAGVSVQRGGGELSLSYIKREVSWGERGVGSFSEDEDFAGVSFTLRR